MLHSVYNLFSTRWKNHLSSLTPWQAVFWFFFFLPSPAHNCKLFLQSWVCVYNSIEMLKSNFQPSCLCCHKDLISITVCFVLKTNLYKTLLSNVHCFPSITLYIFCLFPPFILLLCLLFAFTTSSLSLLWVLALRYVLTLPGTRM